MAEFVENDRTLSLVFTDLAGSTALKTEKGDSVALELISRHRALVEGLASEGGGRIEVWAGDGCFLTFESSSAAVMFALRLQQAHAENVSLPGVRVGIHVGEVTEQTASSGEVHIIGLAVDLASRIESLGRTGQVLMSSAVFDSVRKRLGAEELGKPVKWLAHGAYEFKGIDDSVDICEAGIEGLSPLAAPEGGEKAHRAVTPGEEDTLGWRPAVDLNVPRRDNWRLERQLGEGGFGEVWLAVHEKTKAKRVFKFCFEAARVRGLKREVVLFRLLKETLGDREDIAQILDWDFDHPPFFIEVEYTEGGDLHVWAERKGGLAAVPLETRLDLVAQVAVALGAAHSVGVLHKDIKPANVLISEPPDDGAPRARLADFGIGLVTDREALVGKGITVAGLTQTLLSSSTPSTGAGTQLYMAPEVIEGKPATTLSDVYALGVLLYQMIKGDFHHALAPGWERDVEDPLLVEDIGACVDGNPDRRLGGATELATRLRSLVERRAAREEEARTRQAVEQARKRRRQLTIATAMGISLTVIAGLFALRENRRAGEQAQLAAREKEARFEAEAARREAEIARAEADAARAAEAELRAEAEYRNYVADMDLIEQALSSSDLSTARNRLSKTEPRLRGWEWGYFADKSVPEEVEYIAPKAIAGEELTAEERWLGATPQLVATLTGHTGNIFYPRFSSDGSRLVSRSVVGEVFIWDMTAFERISVWQEDRLAGMDKVSFDPSGRFVVTPSGSDACVFEVDSGREITCLGGSEEILYGEIRFSPDGKFVIAGNASMELIAWDWRNERKAWSRQLPPGFSVNSWTIPAWVGFRDSGGFVFAEDPDTMVICSMETGETLEKIEMDVPDGFFPVELSTQIGRIAYYNPQENKYLFVGFPSGEPLGEPWSDPADASFGSITSSPDGTLIAIRGDSTTIRLLNAGSAAPFLAGPMPVIEGVSLPHGDQRAVTSPYGRLIAVPQSDNSIMIFAPKKDGGPSRKGVYAHADSVGVARFMGSDDELATASFDGTIRVWDLKKGVMLREIEAHDDGIMELVPSADYARWLTTSYDGTCAVWDLNEGSRLFTSPTGPDKGYGGGLRGPLLRLGLSSLSETQFSPDGDQLVMPGKPGGALVIDTATFEERHALESDVFAYRRAFSPDGASIVTHGQAPTARLWDAADGTLRGVLDGGSNFLGTAFSRDSKRIVASHMDGRITVWETGTGRKLQDWKAHQSIVMTVKFDPSGERLLTSSSDGTAAIWDTETWERLAVCEGHSGFVIAARFNPAGDRILTLGFDGTARVWDLQGNEMVVLNTNETILNGTWSPTGRRIAVTTKEGHAFVYDSIPAEELDTDGKGVPLRELVLAWRQGQSTSQ